MALRCAVCGKRRKIGHNVSYSKRRTRRVFLPNLHWARLLVGGKMQRVKVCMSCLKRAKKEGRVGQIVKAKAKETTAATSSQEEVKPLVKKRVRPRKATK